MNLRIVATALLTTGTLCCSFGADLNFELGSGGNSTQGCSSEPSCPVLGSTPSHALADASIFVDGCPAFVCETGWVSCGQTCSTNVAADPNNCGACGNVCGSGTCALGSCQQVDVLATGFAAPSGLGLDDANVYFGGTVGGASDILSVEKAGGATTTVASDSSTPTSIAVDATGIYFTISVDDGLVDSPILAVRAPGVPIERVAGYAGAGSSLLLDGANVLWNGEIDDGDGGAVLGIFSAPETGGEPTLLLPTSYDPFAANPPTMIQGIASTAGDLFFIDGSTVNVLRAGATAPTRLYTDTSSLLVDVATDGNYVYWYGIGPYPCAGCGTAQLVPTEARRLPLAGGFPDDLFAPAYGTRLLPAAGSVYTVVADVLSRVDPSTGVSVVVAGGEGEIVGVAADESFVYWVVAGDGSDGVATGGRVFRIAL